MTKKLKAIVEEIAKEFESIISVHLVDNTNDDITLILDYVGDGETYWGFLERIEQQLDKQITLLDREGVEHSALKDSSLQNTITLCKKKFNMSTPKEEVEKILATNTSKVIQDIRDRGRTTRHGDEKGVYDLYPCGERVYIKEE